MSSLQPDKSIQAGCAISMYGFKKILCPVVKYALFSFTLISLIQTAPGGTSYVM